MYIYIYMCVYIYIYVYKGKFLFVLLIRYLVFVFVTYLKKTERVTNLSFLFQVPLISCASPWRAGGTENGARPKLN